MPKKNFLNLKPERKNSVMEYAIKRKWAWGTLKKWYKQPKWCEYPDALHGRMGCWSLMNYGDDTSRWYKNKCGTCELSRYLRRGM